MESIVTLAEKACTALIVLCVVFVVLNGLVKIMTMWEKNVERRAYAKIAEEAQAELDKLAEDEKRAAEEHKAKMALLAEQKKTESLRQEMVRKETISIDRRKADSGSTYTSKGMTRASIK